MPRVERERVGLRMLERGQYGGNVIWLASLSFGAEIHAGSSDLVGRMNGHSP